MTYSSEDPVPFKNSTSPSFQKFFRGAAILAVVLLFLLTPGISKPAYSQSGGELNTRFASGYPQEIPADGKSTTVLEATTEDCNFGVPIDSNGSFFVNGGLPATISLLDGDISKEPLRFLLTAPSEPGMFVIEWEISYCPPGAIALMGVCSDPAYENVKCHGWNQIFFYDPENIPEDIGLTDNPDSAASEQAASEQAASEQARSEQATSEQTMTEQAMSENEASSEVLLTELYDELEEFLAGEDITAPTPGQIGASGTAIVTLLVGWLVLNQRAGISADKSLEVIQAWKDGERPEVKYDGPTIGAEAELPGDYGDGDVGAEGEVPDKPPESADPDKTLVTKRSSVQESGEDRLLRGIKDTQDYDDALKKTNKDIEAFEGKIPDQLKNSEAWKKHVGPKLKKAKDLLKKGELDKARTWLDRAEKILEVRKDVNRELDHLPVEQREGVVRLVQALKAGAHVLSDIFNTTVIEPLKAAGSKLLPPEQANRWKKTMDETGQALSDVGQGIPNAVVKGSKNITHGKIMEQADQMSQDSSPEIRREAQQMKDLYKRDNVDHFDPWGKGTKKAKEIWNHTMRALFHDR